MHSRSDNIKFTSYNDANEAVDELFHSLPLRCQGNLEIRTRRSNFIFHSVHLMYNEYKVNFSCGDSYVDSPVWIKKKKQQQIQEMQIM